MSYYQSMADIYRRLSHGGLDRSFVLKTALPRQWQDANANTAEGRRHAEEYISDALGIDQAALALEDADLGLEDYKEQPAVWVARRVSELIQTAVTDKMSCWFPSTPASQLRQLIVAEHKSVTLASLTEISWTMGAPVVQLAIKPNHRKHINAVVAGPPTNPTIVLCGKESAPSWMAWHLGYTIGHIACGHLNHEPLVLQDILAITRTQALVEADTYASTLIHGEASERLAGHDRITGVKLATLAREHSRSRGLEAGAVVVGFAVEKACQGSNAKGPAKRALRQLGIDKGGGPFVTQALAPRLDLSRLTEPQERFLRQVAGL